MSNETGARVVEQTADALAAQVRRYLADPDLRRQSGVRARAAVLDRFSLDRLVDDVRTLYRDLLAAP